jgi:type III secretion protein T
MGMPLIGIRSRAILLSNFCAHAVYLVTAAFASPVSIMEKNTPFSLDALMTPNLLNDGLIQLLIQAEPYLIALVFAFARIQGVLQTFPLFTTLNVRGQIKAVFALVLCIPIVPMLAPQFADSAFRVTTSGQFPPLPFMLVLIGKEYLIGVMLGTLMAIPFWAVQTAGDLIDMDRGASAANLSDPVNANEQSLTGVILLYATLAIFVVMDGLQIVISMIYDTFRVLKPTELLPTPDLDLVQTLGMLIGKMVITGAMIAGPILVMTLAVDVTLVFSARIAKQLPLNDFSIIVKNLIAASFLPLYALFLGQYFVKEWNTMLEFIKGFIKL